MSKEKRRVPKLRFPGFTEDWEQRKLSDILKVNSGKDYKHLEQGDIPVYGTGGYMLSVNESLSNIDAIGIGRKGTIDKPQYLKAPFWTVDTLFYLTALDKHSILFLYYLMQLMPWKKFDESTGVPSLSKTTIDNINGYVPSNPKEEELISTLFNQLDKSITLHQRKLNNLKLKKKALLQKLFPKNGKRYPELRFPGFTDAWEQRKLGECMDSFEYGLNAAAKEYDGMHKYIRITDIDDETHNFIQSNLTSPDIDFNSDVSDYKLNVNDIVFARTGASVGKTYLYNQNDGDLYYAGFLIRGKVNEDCDAGFIYQNTLTTDYDSFIRITSQRSGQPGVNSKEYTTFRLNIPCKGEQEKISKLLNRLDKLFTLHQRKLDHLQLQKKALLQQMFV